MQNTFKMNLDKKSLNVFFAVDANYLVHFTVTLTSLLENNKNLDISVYVIHDFKNVELLEEVTGFFNKNYNLKIFLIKVNDCVFDNFHISMYISKATYFRLLFADIIPLDVISGLYIDCDIVVAGPLDQLIDLNFANTNSDDEYSILAVDDKNGGNEIKRFNQLGFSTPRYFNAGVMYINLSKWRADRVSEKLIKIAEEYKSKLVWWDQDVLNIHFINKSGYLDSTFNSLPDKKQPSIPTIIHYSGSSKPWQYFNTHPYKDIYWKYLRLTPFKNEKFENVTIRMRLKKLINTLRR